jgi:hypothetical protein
VKGEEKVSGFGSRVHGRVKEKVSGVSVQVSGLELPDT